MYKGEANPIPDRAALMRGIPIDILRAFVAVVEARGFTRAAEELGRTQPTISLQVKRLEELVEAPLFKKGGRFELSGVGEVCFDYGKRLLRLHDDMLDEVGGRNNPNGALRIGMPSEFASVLAPRLAQLRADAETRAAFEVMVESSQALSAAFRQNALDVAFVIGDGRKRTPQDRTVARAVAMVRPRRPTAMPAIGRCRWSSRRKGRLFTRRRRARCAPRGGNSTSFARVPTSPCSPPPLPPVLASCR